MPHRAKKLLFVIGLLCALYSCKKSASAKYGVFYATVNAANDTFDINVLALRDSTLGGYTLSVVGFKSAYGDSTKGGFESAQLGFQIVSPTPIKTGKYVYDTTGGSKQLTMLFIPAKFSFYDSVIFNTPFLPTVEITKINNGNVQGTFSGVTFYSDTSKLTFIGTDGVIKRTYSLSSGGTRLLYSDTSKVIFQWIPNLSMTIP